MKCAAPGTVASTARRKHCPSNSLARCTAAAATAAQHQHRQVEIGKHAGPEPKTIGARPIAEAYGGRPERIGPQARRPGRKRAGPTIKVDHAGDRLWLATAKG